MKLIKYIFFSILLVSVIFSFYTCNDAGVVKPKEGLPVFIKTYGGSASDRVTSMSYTIDGGMLITGYTISAGSGGNDGFALKIDSKGNTQWYNVFGGSGNDQINSVFTLSDGGFILAGETSSFSSSSTDVFAVRLDISGNLVWSKYYRITGNEFCTSVIQVADHGFLFCGYTDGSGAGNNDVLVIKTDFSGNVTWINTYGDALNDYGSAIRAFSDNSSILAGYTFSGGAGAGDISLMRLFPDGNIAWTKYYGGAEFEQPYHMEITSDNGYIIAGLTYSFGLTNGDSFVLRTDGNGYVYWSRTFGGSNLDQLYSIKQTGEGKFIAAGYTSSFGLGLQDAFVLKLFGDGNFEWARIFGSTYDDGGTSILVRNDTGYVVSGYTQSYGSGNNDIYTIAMKEDGISCSADSPVTPNGGTPTTIINEVTIIMNPVVTYETINAGTTINTFPSGENTVCAQQIF